ncbi:glycosyltransferase family 4 protein [Opitutales bacterium]|nr:glycosyltransferase family 4 protein [Opitutales bacterium]
MSGAAKQKKALIVWGNWGPYHYSRFKGFKQACTDKGIQPIGLELFQKSNIYEWSTSQEETSVKHFSFGEEEMAFPIWKCFTQLLPYLWKLKADYAFVPSYWHWSLFINFICRIRGAKIIMMNESHEDTERAKGIKRWIKSRIVKRFHAAFVGGKPHARHFESLGMKPESIFPGYDAIDVSYFAEQADDVRSNATEKRNLLGLPDRYFLSLSRMVEKKNLPGLVEAYSRLNTQPMDPVPHLVFVGSGPLEKEVREAVIKYELPHYDHTEGKETGTIDNHSKGVHFYGFRQIDVNPTFFTLADAFIMPSLWEEWGLVVNEALACSTPVIVSANAGCAEDLVIEGETGYKIDPRNIESITTAMSHIGANTSDLQKMGTAGLTIVKQFDCTNFGNNAMSSVEYTNR